jgi:hypothetical protein
MWDRLVRDPLVQDRREQVITWFGVSKVAWLSILPFTENAMPWQGGADVRLTRKLLGHATLETTQI